MKTLKLSFQRLQDEIRIVSRIKKKVFTSHAGNDSDFILLIS